MQYVSLVSRRHFQKHMKYHSRTHRRSQTVVFDLQAKIITFASDQYILHVTSWGSWRPILTPALPWEYLCTQDRPFSFQINKLLRGLFQRVPFKMPALLETEQFPLIPVWSAEKAVTPFPFKFFYSSILNSLPHHLPVHEEDFSSRASGHLIYINLIDLEEIILQLHEGWKA